MARGTQLIQLLDQLRAEVGHSLQPATGKDARQHLISHLQRSQELLYDGYDWPFLRILPYKNLSAGQRYYDLPSDLNLERVEAVVTYWGNDPSLVERGIDWSHYAQFDPDADERNDPVLRWDVRWVPAQSAEMIEVWPVPATNTKLQWQGLRKLRPLLQDSDVAELDDRLIVLTAAAEILARNRKSDADMKRGLANQRLIQLKGRLKHGQHVTHMTGDTDRRERGRSIVRISASPPNTGGN